MGTADYRELQVLLEDMVQAWPGASTDPALDVARTYMAWAFR
jgi:hypothetical protein